jgi:predicted transcriptional regulator
MGTLMKKTDMLFNWLKQKNDWVYLMDVPHETFGMSKAQLSSALISFCNQGRCDFRVIRMKQYRVKEKNK